MSGRTTYFGLHMMGAGELFSENGYQHLWADRALMDLLLHVGASAHVHSGATATDFAPTLGPTLIADTSTGLLPAGVRVYYKVSFVDGATGIESAASPEVFVDLPSPVAEPASATLYPHPSGALTAGTYQYVLSAYVSTSTEETLALSPTSVVLQGSDNQVTVAFPTLPAGADGWNVYRRAPGDVSYFFLASFNGTNTDFTDDGIAHSPNCTRGLPTSNITNGTNAVNITLPGLTPFIPDGMTWNIYRTLVTGDWDNSLLHRVVEGVTTYTDLGHATSTGRPLTATVLLNSPPKIDLTGGGEVQGVLPMGMTAYPFTVTFAFPDHPLTVQAGKSAWVCEYPHVAIVGARGALSRASYPAAQPVKFDVLVGTGATPTYTTIFGGGTPPSIAVGAQVGTRAAPTGTNNVAVLNQGDSIVVDLTQAGGGATPTDHDATLTLYCVAYGYDTTSYVAGTAIGA